MRSAQDVAEGRSLLSATFSADEKIADSFSSAENVAGTGEKWTEFLATAGRR
jgi:hypothetical protein